MNKERMNRDVAATWFKSRQWAGNLVLKAHESVDVTEFSFQYAKKRDIWDKAFAWLSQSNLETIIPGKYEIDGDRVYASVAEAKTKSPEEARWEAHRKYADIQYVVHGAEQIGVAHLTNAKLAGPFNTSHDIGFYEIPETECKYFKAVPGTFFIFFPNDAHRPCIRAEGIESDKKVVIKVSLDD